MAAILPVGFAVGKREARYSTVTDLARLRG